MIFRDLIIQNAEKYNIPPAIVYGVCMQESSMSPYAARYEKHYRWLYKPKQVKPKTCSLETERIFQKTSFGMMQMMGGVYRELGYEGWLTEIIGKPELQMDYGCKFLGKKIKKFGLERGILAYNSGSPRMNESGDYINAYYLTNVIAHAKGFN